MNGIEVAIVGNLTRDAELRFSQNGRAWATFSVAVNEIATVNGERRDTTSYVDCKVFGEQAEYLVESAGKGNRVFVTGKLRDEKWTDQSGAERRTKVVYVDEVGVSLRWATAALTKKQSNNSSATPVAATNNGGDYAPSAQAEVEENPFM